MKTILLFLLSFVALNASNNSSASYWASYFTVAGSSYDIAFQVTWTSDDFPFYSAPGRLEVLDSGGTVVARIIASDYGSGPDITVSGSGYVDNASSYVGRYAGGDPVDGTLSATWHITGLAPGDYMVKAWRYRSWETMYSATTVFTHTSIVSSSEPVVVPPPPTPPDPEPPVAPPPVQFSLATSADAGGSVTPGGSYPSGSLVTITAAPDASHYFGGWAGDAAGGSLSATVTVDRDLSVFATFLPKGSQAISFAPLPNQSLGAPPQTLSATSSSGLPVAFSVTSGPATLAGDVLTITGPGVVTITATQNGDGTFLPASPVSRSFTTNTVCVVRYQNPSRTLLGNAEPNAHYVLPSLP